MTTKPSVLERMKRRALYRIGIRFAKCQWLELIRTENNKLCDNETAFGLAWCPRHYERVYIVNKHISYPRDRG